MIERFPNAVVHQVDDLASVAALPDVGPIYTDLGEGKKQLNQRLLPTTLVEAWRNFVDVVVAVSDVPEELYLLPMNQNLAEEVGLGSLHLNDGRETLGALHGMEIPPLPDPSMWPTTVEEFFKRYVSHTPAQAELDANPSHWLLSREEPILPEPAPIAVIMPEVIPASETTPDPEAAPSLLPNPSIQPA